MPPDAPRVNSYAVLVASRSELANRVLGAKDARYPSFGAAIKV